MFSKLVTLCALVAASSAVLIGEPHYSSGAISSQNYVRHDQPKLAVAAPVYAYQAAPAISYAAPVAKVAYAAPAVSYAAPVAKVAYAAPAVSYAAPVAKVAYAAPITKLSYAHQEEIAYPKYEYTYSVVDGHTGDKKAQQESRDGDVVKGSYSFLEADGSIRTVEYTADDHNGFNAVVHNTAPTAAPHIIKAAPLLLKSAAPVYYQH